MFFLEFREMVFNNILVSSFSSGFLSGIISMASRSVPVSSDWFGFEFDCDSELFTKSDQNISGNSIVITTFNSMSNTNLVLPLTSSNFSIKSCNLDSSFKTKSKVSFSQISSKSVLISNRTVILELWVRISSLRPSKGPLRNSSVSNKHEVFLFNTEPRFTTSSFFHDLISKISEVSCSWSLLVRQISFT